MSWITERRTVTSEKNGAIVVRRTFGRWDISVGGAEQTSPYTNRMWRKAVARIPRDARVRRILVLGVCAGGCVASLLRRYPKSHITGIEWDPEMVHLLKETRVAPRTDRFEILLGDVRETIATLRGAFDLVIFDLFTGPRIDERLMRGDFLESVRGILERDGHLILNAYRQREAMDAFQRFFFKTSEWRFKYNVLGSFRPFGSGNVGAPLAHGYVPFRSSPAYLTRESAGTRCDVFQNASGAFGWRWNAGPILLEKYYDDREPIREMNEPRRVTIWQPFTRTDAPRGWLPIPLPITSRLTGYAEIFPDRPLTDGWSEAVLRHLARWNRSTRGKITETTADAFLAGCRASTLPSGWKKALEILIPSKQRKHGERVRLWVIENPETPGGLLAGLAVLDIPEISQSIHLAAFLHESARKSPAGVGLILHWFETSREKGYRFLDFDQFWSPGEPRSWRGFSRFKDQFGVRYVRYPKTLLRL